MNGYQGSSGGRERRKEEVSLNGTLKDSLNDEIVLYL